MKKIMSILAVVIFAIILLGTVNVKAISSTEKTEEYEWTNFNDAKIEIVGVPPKNVSIEDATLITYNVKVSNVTLNPNNTYSVMFHTKDTEITKNQVLYHSDAVLKQGEYEAQINMPEVFLQKSDDIYVSILERKEDKQGDKDTALVVKSRKVDHPELLPKLGNRINIYFDNISTKIFYFAPNNNNTGGQVDRKLNVKIAKITDTNILKQVKENKSVGLQNLLNYAKNANSYDYTGALMYEESKNAGTVGSIMNNITLTDGAYYATYIEVDTENGVYYPVEDVSLYRAKGTNKLIRLSDKDFVWEFKEEKPTTNSPVNDNQESDKKAEQKQDTTQYKGRLPQTGEKVIYSIIIILALALAIFGYAKYKKYRD